MTNMAQAQTQTEKIINYFTEEYPHVGLTAESLKKPQFDTAYEAYRCLTSAIFGLPESLFVPDENEPQMPLQILLRLMQSVINDTTTDGFVITDLTHPKPARFRFFLSSLIDFYKFILQHFGDVDSLFNEVNDLQVKLNDDRTAVAKLGDEIQRQKNQNELAKRKRLDLSARVSQLKSELADFQNQKEQIKETVAGVDEQINKKQEKIVALESAIVEAIEECRQLDLDIISSPDKIFSEIQRTEELVAKCENEIIGFKKEARDSARKKSEAEAMAQEVDEFDNKISGELKATLKLVHEQRQALKESDSNLQSLKTLNFQTERDCATQKTEVEDASRKLQADFEHLQETIGCSKEKLSTLQQGIDQTYKNAEIKDKKDKRDLAARFKQYQQALLEMEEEHQRKKETVTSLMNEISSFVQEEEELQKESTNVYEKVMCDIKTNETFNLIQKLLAEHVELANRKREMETNRNQTL